MISDIQEYDYGQFVIFEDPFGNQIELWQAQAETYKNMVKEELKNYKK
jgi:hypothetical protein